ncbi:MAG: molybdenum cofactor guanylyltransferase [Legionella longbeachae]|nr:molybdenum cofactor guanylyltransferase [Legionella longbeachae]
MSTSQFVGLVLAGGQSSRMGTNKSELVFQNKTLLEIACSCLRSTGVNRIIVSGAYSGYVCIQDEWPFSGPAAAILSAAVHSYFVTTAYMLVLPVDMPLLATTILIRLMNAMENERVEASFIKNNPLPCCIKVAALKKVLNDYLNQPAISMQKLLTEKLNYKALDCNEVMKKSLTNINTPAAFSKLRMDYET